MAYIYIAGPYRGKDALAHDHTAYHNIDAHINEAHRWASRLAKDSIFYFCPHLNGYHMEVTAPSASPEFWLALDFEFLRKAWALFLLPGWRDSAGTMEEKLYAVEHKMPIFFDHNYELMREAYAIHTAV